MGSLIAAVEGERRRSHVCPVAPLLADPEHGPDLASMLPLPKRYPAAAIGRALIGLGLADNEVTAVSAVKRHRQQKCGCAA